MPGPRKSLLALAALFLAALAYFLFLKDKASFGWLQENLAAFQAAASARPVFFSIAYFFSYVGVTALSLPGAALLTLAGGAVFGFTQALLIVSFASSIGATLAFLLARYLFRDWVESRFPEQFSKIRRGFEREGQFYLIFARLTPAFPFFAVNLLFGLTRISASRFYLASQVAMLPGTAIYVNAGTELAKIRNPEDIMSARLVLALTLLGVFPLLAKKGIEFWRKRNVG